MKKLIGASTLLTMGVIALGTPAFSKSIRVDYPGGPDCQIGNWGGVPAGSSIGSATANDSNDTAQVCTPSAKTNASLADATASTSIFNTNPASGGGLLTANGFYYAENQNSQYLATTQSEMVAFLYNGGDTNSADTHSTSATFPSVDAQVVFWTLANKDYEVEIWSALGNSSWCTSAAQPSFTIGSTSYSGGCSGAVSDFLFNSSKQLIGYVDNTTGTIDSPATLTGWTVKTLGGPVSAPEVDPAAAASGLTMLFSAVAVMRGRRRRR